MNMGFSGSPVIIIGMHRSGTSVLCRLLAQLGLFAGNDQTRKNHESYFFVQINRWIFEQCGAAWDRPASVKELLAQGAMFGLCVEHVRQIISSPYSASFLGGKAVSLSSLSSPWGWKDPRSTFTLPVWLEVFPEAKVLNVTRNGVDVANSLKVREDAYLQKRSQDIARGQMLRKRTLLRPKLEHKDMRKLVLSMRCLNLEGGLSLWEEYMDEARAHVQQLGGRALEIRYEEMLAAPEEVLATACAFSGLSVSGAELSRAAGELNRSRANSYLQDPVLKDFAAKNQARLNRF